MKRKEFYSILVLTALCFLPAFQGCSNYLAEVKQNDNLQEVKDVRNLKEFNAEFRQNYILESTNRQFATNGDYFWAGIPHSGIAKSTDGGKSWQALLKEENQEISELLNDPSKNIFFISEDHGWISGDNQTWETENGGKTWKILYKKQFENIFFYNENIGWMNIVDNKNNRSKFYTTRNGGKNWITCPNQEAIRLSPSAFFVSFDVGWAFLIDHENRNRNEVTGIVKTENGGCSWKKVWQAFDNPDYRYNDLFFVDQNNGWFSTHTDNGLFSTKDGGLTWKKLPIPDKIAEIETFFFADENNGWILFASEPDNPIFYKTYDGGNSWNSASKEELIQSFNTQLNFPRVSDSLRRAIVIYH